MPVFEDAVTRGLAQYLTRVSHDLGAREFIVELTHDPDSETQRIVRFAGVSALDEFWNDREDHCMEGLLAAYEEENASGFRYLLVTDQREIALATEQLAVIYDVLPG
ncbi:MAG: hypothetical protein ACO1QR_08520 [Chthoniobacteraceae bacterium]